MTPPQPAYRLLVALALAASVAAGVDVAPGWVVAALWIVAALRIGQRLEWDEWARLDVAVVEEVDPVELYDGDADYEWAVDDDDDVYGKGRKR